MKTLETIVVTVLLGVSAGLQAAGPAAAGSETTVTVSGLILPRDKGGMYLRNPEGQFAIEWSERTRVALEVNTRLFRGLKGNTLHYRIPASDQSVSFTLPAGPTTAIIPVRNAGQLARVLHTAQRENWISEAGLILRFGETLPDQLPTAGDLRFIGRWDRATTPRTVSIQERKYELSLKKGGQKNALLMNVVGADDLSPYVNRAHVIGRKQGTVIQADQIHMQPIGDQTASDDPQLPRYLFIGDSISGNYTQGLRAALKGKFNVHHPPTNCGPSSKGKQKIVEWLGGYWEPNRKWDVISFNFGHWDAGSDKASYQENLEAVISELQRTGAKLIWVTTCPVPTGFPPAGGLSPQGKAPRRTAGVMQRYLNPWALEVVRRHPDISVCDQWEFVKRHAGDIYETWWAGKNVHFRGETAEALGRLLAEHVVRVTR